MARAFDDGSSEYLEIDQAVIATPPFAIGCCYYKDSQSHADTLIWIGDKDADTDRHMLYLSAANNNLKFNSYDGSAGQAECTSGSWNTWRHGCGILVSDTDRRVLMDGAYKGTNTTDITVSNLDRTSIGRQGHATPAGYMSGHIAEVAIWDLSVWPGATDSDKADNFESVLPSFAQFGVGGVSPLYFSLGLVAYWPLVRDINDRVGGYSLTANGTTQSGFHPKVFYSGPQTAAPISAAGTAVGVMTLNTRYWG